MSAGKQHQSHPSIHHLFTNFLVAFEKDVNPGLFGGYVTRIQMGIQKTLKTIESQSFLQRMINYFDLGSSRDLVAYCL